ncbi:MAG: 4Fe-4S ferredoxin, partial [Clostridia bacterium]|nr:4Fe-4S ferredoxin [Clostridia bacterium]
MKRVYVNEKWCLGCHLCEYNCAYANVGGINMYLSLKDKKISPNVRIEEKDNITYAVACRHCSDPICLKSCIAGAISQEDGV